jgi:hypothetical protein
MNPTWVFGAIAGAATVLGGIVALVRIGAELGKLRQMLVQFVGAAESERTKLALLEERVHRFDLRLALLEDRSSTGRNTPVFGTPIPGWKPTGEDQ